jgi:Domain of unknown function (DUF4350)
MKVLKQYWQVILLTVAAIVLLTIISATGGDPRQVGSSYSIAANGYSSWYQTMLDRGVKIQRWQKSFPQLAKSPAYETGTTLLQVNPELERSQLTNAQQEWVKKGNTIVILGVMSPAWDSSFENDLDSDRGKIRVETTRRFGSDISGAIGLSLKTPRQTILGDRSGIVIDRYTLDRGAVIVATTPHLAANAYQDFKPNYELLAALVSADRQQILVDEFIHGYVDRESNSQQEKIDAIAYFAKTPLIVVLVNLILGTLVAIWQQNRRFGKVFIPKSPEIDNSEAYIQALGGVLRQANSSEFLLQKIGRAERLSWQQRLGLGKERLVEPELLIATWEDRLKLPADDLRFVLQLTTGDRRPTKTELTSWLTKVREIDRQLGVRI